MVLFPDLLRDRNFVTKTESYTLCFASDSNMAYDRSVTVLLKRYIRQCVFSKYTARIQVGREEAAVITERMLWSQTAHICGFQYVIEVVLNITRNKSSDCNEIRTYVIFVFTLTLFSHSNSVHMARN